MSEVKFEEYSNMSYEDQLQHVEGKLQRMRKAKAKSVEDIRKIEEYVEVINQQIETLLEMKFNVLHQQRMEEVLNKVKNNVFGE